MRIDVLTLFPEMFTGPLTESILKRARDGGLLHIALHNIRDYTDDKHHVTDETPYGGGGGMVMKVEPIVRAVESVLEAADPRPPVILMTPHGRVFTQAIARELAAHEHLLLICGHYEGIDERVRELVVTDMLSIGDYVLTGGELPAMVIMDAVARYLPGVLGAPGAADDDSHATGLLEHATYTRPPSFRGLAVPPELLSGDHGAIAKWRRRDALRRTWQSRPDMLISATLSEDERYFLAQLARSGEG